MLPRRLTSATETLPQLCNLPSYLDTHQGMSRGKDAEVETEKQGDEAENKRNACPNILQCPQPGKAVKPRSGILGQL